LSNYLVLIGACGWRHPQWDTSFYPEDLPPEWQLAYYGNEYPVVLIPAGYWTLDLEKITQQCEESEDRPCFVCEWPLRVLETEPAQIHAALERLGDRVEAIMLKPEAEPIPASLQALRQLAETHAVCLDLPPDAAQDWRDVMPELQGGHGVSLCWRGDLADCSCLQYGPLAIARINCAGQTPRSLRMILEALLASAGNRQAVLLFEGDPPDPEIMDQAEVVLNLL